MIRSKFSGGQRSSTAPPKKAPLPPGFWCAQCDGVGLIPICFVSPKGRVQRMNACCECEAGDRLDLTGVGLRYLKAKALDLLDPDAKTRHAHWLHSIRRYFTLIERHETVEMIDAISRSQNPADALREWQKKHPPKGPLAMRAPSRVRT